MPSVDFADVVNPTDILVRYLTGDAHLTMKARERRSVAQLMFGKKFQRDGLRELQVVGPIDLAHSAFAQESDDSIAIGQDRAGHKARIVDRIERTGGTSVSGCGRGCLQFLSGIVE